MNGELELPKDYVNQQRMCAVNQLAAGVAHEFNNVLQVVCGYVKFARDAMPPGSESRGDLDQALEATGRAGELSARLLQFARAESGDSAVADVHDAVEGMRLLLKPIIGVEARLVSRAPASLPAVAADDALLRQALLNLCLNARDAMPLGGEITISGERSAGLPEGDRVIGDVGDRPCVRVVVEDTGVGIERAALDRITEPFYSTKGAGLGTGLGLPMVASFVLGANGALAVSSRVGDGSRFEMHLPLYNGVAPDGVADPSRCSGEGATRV